MVRTTWPRDLTRFRSRPAGFPGSSRFATASSIQTQNHPTSLSGVFFKAQKDETPDIAVGGLQEKSGGVLLSHKVSLAVPLALASLTSEFEMGSGVTSPL